MDDLDESLAKEKKSKIEADKLKRRVEGVLKLTQEMVVDLERVKEELEITLQRKEKVIFSIYAKVEDEQTLGMFFLSAFVFEMDHPQSSILCWDSNSCETSH